ncbi:CLUMA_CG004337, isoform A [Clunio marinus]|uniref:CLUMA_CG004337, isoform A n=1 Tax=Clunio marinus TaxID=568069 RepID=A0A1J1HRM8_9DIPT|nr:CLUMA_CG004337, isoform A [Clunio marinus]
MQCEEMKNLFLNRPTGIKIGSAVFVTGLISYLKFRPFAILVSSVYVTWIFRTFYSHYTIHIPKELIQRCTKMYDECKNLRKNRPNVFCGFITSILFLLAVIGHFVDGTYILFICLIAGVLVTSKYEIKIIKDNNDSTPNSSVSGIDIDEFCPSLDEANMRILKQIGDHADDTGIYSPNMSRIDNESDSDNELLPPKNVVIPEPDEIDAMEDDETADLLIDPKKVLTQSAEYKKKHFSNTSSDSDSDDSITRGLDFKNIPVTATIEPQSSPSSLLSNIQQTLTRNLIDNLTKPSPKSSQSKPYDSEDEISDFEILDKDDLLK